MANESNTSIPLNDASDSTDYSSSEERSRPEKRRKNAKVKVKDKKIDLLPKTKRVRSKRRVVTVCLTHCRYDVIRRIAQKFGYKEISEGENWNMYWTDLSITVDRCKDMKRFQKINHFPGNEVLSTKSY